MGFAKAAGTGGSIAAAGTLGFFGGAIAVTTTPVTLPLLGVIGAITATTTAIGAGIGSFVKFLSD